MDARYPNWDLWLECQDRADFETFALPLLPDAKSGDPFWVMSARSLFVATTEQLRSNPDRSIKKLLQNLLSISLADLHEFLQDTDTANLVDGSIEKTAMAIRIVLSAYVKALRYCQGLEKENNPPFSIRQWVQNIDADGWIFISSDGRLHAALRPLISTWLNITMQSVLALNPCRQRRIWTVLDELPSLHKIVDLSGVPNEIAGITSAAIARIIFQLKVWQSEEERKNSPVLLVCEEAHRYVPNRGEAQYEAAQSAIRRIAKEGRKYGVGLFLVSQRSSEVEATVLSQCNSWIVLRITNDSDREHVRSVLPDSMSGLTKTLSGLRRQEAIFVGQAATLPSRIMIRNLSNEQLPRSSDVNFDEAWQKEALTPTEIEKIVKKRRYQTK